MDKKLLLLIFVFLLVFTTFTGSLFLSRENRAVRASKRTPVAEKSLCLASAVSAPIGQNTLVTCVARDGEASAVSGAQCCFSITSGTGTTTPTCEITDVSGMAKTNVTSGSAGTTQINCMINGSIPAGTVSVAFN